MIFWKAHGLANDYLVFEGDARGWSLELTAELVRGICDRHRGIGADGVLEPTRDTRGADYGVRIWNPDGSVAEKSGNGLRIYARWLRSVRNAPESFAVWTGACRVRCHAGSEGISVEMGMASFEPREIPVDSESEIVDGPLSLSDATLSVTVVGIGNPHCVVFLDVTDLDQLPWRAWGAQIETHPRFPKRTNVQFACVASPSQVLVRIWERGAGETLASGSSACAVAAAGVRTGRLAPGRIQVLMPGGVLWVTVSEDGLLLEGPVEVVGRFELSPEFRAPKVGGLSPE